MAATGLTNPAATPAPPGTNLAPSGAGMPPPPAGTTLISGAETPAAGGALATLGNNLPSSVTRYLDHFNALSGFHKIGLMVGLAVIVTFLVVALMWSRKEPIPYHILYGGLAEADSAQVMEALQKNNIPFRIDPTSGALTVPAPELHATRIKLAGLGLPKTPPVGGFEILDNQSPFGSSQFMEGARYQRALEGELAHSILTLGAVQSARVHLALPRPSIFVRDREKPSASVVLQLQPGRYLDRGQVEAIIHLVASSIPQLEPNRVTVVDQSGELLSRQDSTVREMDLTKAQFEHVRRVEDSYVRRIENILSPLAGSSGVRAQVTLDMDFSDTEQTREIYNPDQPSLRSEQTVEEQSRGGNDFGIPGALSNQPPAAGTVPEKLNSGGPPPEAGKGNIATNQNQGSGDLVTKRHATRNYEVDRTISHTRSPIGQIRRISAAVIVDDAWYPANPAQRMSRSPEEMERIRALVREAIGYDAQRGDAVSVVNLPFMPNFDKEGIADEIPWWRQPWALELFRQGLAAFLVLVLILGVLRPITRHIIGEEEKPEEPEAEETEKEEPEAEEKKAEKKEIEENEEEEEEEEEDEEEEDDTRELRPAAEGADEVEIPNDQLTLSPPVAPEEQLTFSPPEQDTENELALASPEPEQTEDQLALSPPEHESEPAWVSDPKYHYQEYLEKIRHMIHEEPKMASEIIKKWIDADSPSHK